MLRTLLLLVAVVVSPAFAADAPVKPITYDGKALPLAESLKKLGVKPDADTAGIALVLENGTQYTLVKDAKSRLLFMDKQLHNRELRITARLLPGSQMLKVEKVQTINKGKLFDVDYWCDECQLEASEPGLCKCCGAETSLRELPAK